MTFWFLAVLALAWIAVFLPAAMRARQNGPLSTAERFRKRMDSIAPPRTSDGRWVVIPSSAARKGRSFKRGQQARRRIFIFLSVAVMVSLSAAVVTGGGMWEVALAFGGSLALYVSLLLEAKRRRYERVTKVKRISPHPARASGANAGSFVGEAEMTVDEQIRAFGTRRF